MAIYKLLPNGGVLLDNRISIPDNEQSRHWRAYQQWLADGNTPDPDDTPPPATAKQIGEIRINNDKLLGALITVIGNLATPTKTKAQMITLIKAKIT